MGKENTRTLNNTSYGSKKSSKKSSKKNSKKNRSKEPNTTTEEMLDLLNSDTEMTMNTSRSHAGYTNRMVPYQGEIPQQMPTQQMMPQQMAVQNHLAAISPANYDPLMLQQIAPLQTGQNMNMPSNLMTPNAMVSNLGALGGPVSLGGQGMSMPSPLPGVQGNSIPMTPMAGMPFSAPMQGNIANLNMLGGGVKYV